jgi:hypothetical protein
MAHGTGTYNPKDFKRFDMMTYLFSLLTRCPRGVNINLLVWKTSLIFLSAESMDDK